MKKNLPFYFLFFLLVLPFGRLAAQSQLYSLSPYTDSLWVIDTVDYSLDTAIGLTHNGGGTLTGGNGVAVAGESCEMYVIVKMSGVTGRLLATIDPTTGICDTIGNTGENFAGIAFVNDGRLFGITGDGANISETLFEIDINTAAITQVTPLGGGSDGECISYCPDNNKIYHWSGRNTNNAMHSIDPDSGTVDTIAFSGFDWDEVFGAAYIGNGQFRLTNLDQEWITIDTSGFAVLDSVATHEYYRGMDFYDAGPALGFTAIPDTACPGDTIQFATDCANNDTIIFDFGDGSALDTAFSTSHVYTNTGNRTISQIGIRGGIRDTTTLTIRINNVPNVGINPGDTAYLCGPMDTVNLSASSGGQSQWYLNGNILPGATTNNFPATMPGLYNMTKTNQNGCTDSAAVGTRVLPGMPVIASFTQSTDTICVDSVISFTSANLGNDSTDWDFGDGNVAGTTDATHSYASTGTYTVAMTAYGNCGDSTVSSTVVVVDCSVGFSEGLDLPGFTLGHYPNPLVEATQINYTLPEAGNVRLRLLSAMGQEVTILSEGYQHGGAHNLKLSSAGLEAGLYFYRLEYEGHAITRRMLIMK